MTAQLAAGIVFLECHTTHPRAALTRGMSMSWTNSAGSNAAPPIDISRALDLLAASVQLRGDDFVYQPVWMEESRYLTCHYANRGTPDCIVGQALALAGVGIHDLEAMPDDGVRDLYLRQELPVAFTLGAVAVFDAAQQCQDRGRSWGDALAHATATAVRFLDLLPDAILAGQASGPAGEGRWRRRVS